MNAQQIGQIIDELTRQLQKAGPAAQYIWQTTLHQQTIVAIQELMASIALGLLGVVMVWIFVSCVKHGNKMVNENPHDDPVAEIVGAIMSGILILVCIGLVIPISLDCYAHFANPGYFALQDLASHLPGK